MTDGPTASPRPGFHVMAKPTGPICNLDCRYCFYLEKTRLYPGTSNWAMPGGVLETLVRDYIAAHDVPVVTFAWQGGEPTLLGLDFFRRVVELQRRFADGKRIENGLQTNGTLLDDEWGAFLAEQEFLVGLSIDGPRELHDRHRMDRGGKPTFDRVMKGMDVLRRHGAAFNTLTVVHRENARAPLDVYRFLKEVGSGFLQFIPIVERLGTDRAATAAGESELVSGGSSTDTPGSSSRIGFGPHLAEPGSAGGGRVSAWSVDPADWGAFLCTIFDDWVCHDVGQVFVQLFDVALESWYQNQASLCIFNETCGRALAVEHNGDFYSCDHYVFPGFKLGNIMETPVGKLADSPVQLRFGNAKRDTLPAYCRRCEVRFACHGECPKNRFIKTPDGEPGLSYLCAGYKRFFTHVDPYMRFMARELEHERPPADVMPWARARALEEAAARAGRNDPCPCGSGKKYKKCCATSWAGREPQVARRKPALR
jgi:uncharacterized protein